MKNCLKRHPSCVLAGTYLINRNVLDSQSYLLCTECTTFNHEDFIADALRGFTMQITNLPTLFLIIDDASTDRTNEIILSFLKDSFTCTADAGSTWEDAYSTYHFAIHKQNKNCHFLVLSLKKNLYQNPKLKEQIIRGWEKGAKYIARCEGDDYWTDSQKLQKQIDFLESHPDYSMCCHRCSFYYQNEDRWEKDEVENAFGKDIPEDGITFSKDDYLSRTWFIQTMTICFRKEALEETDFSKYKLRRDVHDYYHLLKKGLGYCLSDNMAVYRKHGGGIWSGLSARSQIRTSAEVYRELYYANREDKRLKAVYSSAKNHYFSACISEPLILKQTDSLFKEDIKTFTRFFLLDEGILSLTVYFGKTLKSILQATFR